MSELSNKIAYLKGLAEGLKLAEKSDEGSVITKMIDALSDVARETERVSDICDDIGEDMTVMKESIIDMGMSIDELYGQLDDDDDLFDDDDYLDSDEGDYLDDDADDGLFEIMCPECGEDVIVDFDMLDDDNNIVCPNCHHDIELVFDEDADGTEDESDE